MITKEKSPRFNENVRRRISKLENDELLKQVALYAKNNNEKAKTR
jgi:hypothetical protein